MLSQQKGDGFKEEDEKEEAEKEEGLEDEMSGVEEKDDQFGDLPSGPEGCTGPVADKIPGSLPLSRFRFIGQFLEI